MCVSIKAVTEFDSKCACEEQNIFKETRRACSIRKSGRGRFRVLGQKINCEKCVRTILLLTWHSKIPTAGQKTLWTQKGQNSFKCILSSKGGRRREEEKNEVLTLGSCSKPPKLWASSNKANYEYTRAQSLSSFQLEESGEGELNRSCQAAAIQSGLRSSPLPFPPKASNYGFTECMLVVLLSFNLIVRSPRTGSAIFQLEEEWIGSEERREEKTMTKWGKENEKWFGSGEGERERVDSSPTLGFGTTSLLVLSSSLFWKIGPLTVSRFRNEIQSRLVWWFSFSRGRMQRGGKHDWDS